VPYMSFSVIAMKQMASCAIILKGKDAGVYIPVDAKVNHIYGVTGYNITSFLIAVRCL